MIQSFSSHHTMGSSLLLSRLITTINWFNFFQKEKKDKEIYKASGCHGQQTPPLPSTDLSMEDSSYIFCSENILDEEDVTITKSTKN